MKVPNTVNNYVRMHVSSYIHVQFTGPNESLNFRFLVYHVFHVQLHFCHEYNNHQYSTSFAYKNLVIYTIVPNYINRYVSQ